MSTPEKVITDKQAAFLEALFGEAHGNIRTAMDITGYSKMTKTSEVVSSLREKIAERAGLMLAMNAPKSAFGILEVLDDHSATDARNAISAAIEVLDLTGLVKKEWVAQQPANIHDALYKRITMRVHQNVQSIFTRLI